jgi:phosphoribosylanthranilate isomerase
MVRKYPLALPTSFLTFAGKTAKAMALKTKVKINRITNLTDARYCSGMYVDILGFCLEEGFAQYVSPTQFQEITGWISGIDYAGEFSDLDAYSIERLLANYPSLTWIESEDLDTLVQLKSLGKKLIYRVKLEELDSLFPKVELLQEYKITLHVTSTDKSITIDNESIIKKLSSQINLFLGAGITPENANSLCELPGLYGFALDGGDEIKPGLRDFDQLAAILESLELED